MTFMRTIKLTPDFMILDKYFDHFLLIESPYHPSLEEQLKRELERLSQDASNIKSEVDPAELKDFFAMYGLEDHFDNLVYEGLQKRPLISEVEELNALIKETRQLMRESDNLIWFVSNFFDSYWDVRIDFSYKQGKERISVKEVSNVKNILEWIKNGYFQHIEEEYGKYGLNKEVPKEKVKQSTKVGRPKKNRPLIILIYNILNYLEHETNLKKTPNVKDISEEQAKFICDFLEIFNVLGHPNEEKLSAQYIRALISNDANSKAPCKRKDGE